MKKFKPNPKINVPRWLETIIQCNLYLLFIIIIHYLGLDMEIKNTDFLNFTGSRYSSVLIILLMYYSFKVLGTHTAIDLLEIDYENKEIRFVYWLFYFYKKKLTISYEELSYKNRNDILILGGSLSLRIYQNEKYKIKLNRRNGWKDKQIDEITSEFLIIKPPKRQLIEPPLPRELSHHR